MALGCEIRQKIQVILMDSNKTKDMRFMINGMVITFSTSRFILEFTYRLNENGILIL